MRRVLRSCATALAIRLRRNGIAEDLVPSRDTKRRVLVSYLVFPVMLPRRLRDRRMFSNRGIAQYLVRTLNELGYSVDLIDWRNRSFRPRRDYELFIGHGGQNFAQIARRVSSDTRKVFFATGVRWDVWNRSCAQRAHLFAARHGWYVAPQRTINDDEQSALLAADAVICIGNERAANSYRELGLPAFPVPNAVFPPNMTIRERDWSKARHRLLFFSGGGPILKGLDLLLDAIRDLPVTCHICQRPSPSFDRAYERIGFGRARIVRHGYVPVRSKRFYEIAQDCGFVVAPTAAEGQPGGLLESMATGLIPVVTPEANTDVDACGFVVAQQSPDELHTVLAKAITLQSSELHGLSEAAEKLIVTRHTPDVFRDSVMNAIIRILTCKRA